MKTFGEIKKGDKIYVVNTGTVIPGGVEIICHEALSDYTNELPYNNMTLYGVMIENPFGNEIPLCFNAEDTNSGMYFTTIEEAKQKAIETSLQKRDEMKNEIIKLMNKMFKLHEDVITLNMKVANWNLTNEDN